MNRQTDRRTDPHSSASVYRSSSLESAKGGISNRHIYGRISEVILKYINDQDELFKPRKRKMIAYKKIYVTAG